jgi:hypothetical protein
VRADRFRFEPPLAAALSAKSPGKSAGRGCRKRRTNYLGKKLTARVRPRQPVRALRRTAPREAEGNQAHSLLTRALVVSDRPFPIR